MPSVRRGGPGTACRTGWRPCSSAKQPVAGRHCWAEAALEAGMLAADHLASTTRMPLAALSRILRSQIALGSRRCSTSCLSSLLEKARLC